MGSCPTGFASVDSVCRRQKVVALKAEFNGTWDSTAYPLDAASTPMVAYSRGGWFSGSEYLVSPDLMLSHSFTIQAWVRVSGNSNIFSVSRTGAEIDPAEANEENFINFGDTADQIYFTYAQGSNVWINLTSSTAYAFNDWYLVAVCVEWSEDDKQSSVQLYSNTNQIGSG